MHTSLSAITTTRMFLLKYYTYIIHMTLSTNQLAGEEMEIPDLPANYVMDEFVKAREKAKLPKQGTVMEAAGSWYKKHHD